MCLGEQYLLASLPMTLKDNFYKNKIYIKNLFLIISYFNKVIKQI